jgi:hypothetical protein
MQALFFGLINFVLVFGQVGRENFGIYHIRCKSYGRGGLEIFHSCVANLTTK